jgi:hypothetical protein
MGFSGRVVNRDITMTDEQKPNRQIDRIMFSRLSEPVSYSIDAWFDTRRAIISRRWPYWRARQPES